MNDEYAKVESQLDGVDEAEEEAIKNAVKPKKKITNLGTRVAAGSLAAVQSISATSIAVVLSAILGIGYAGSGEDFNITYRDDYFPDNPYECLDEYVSAYAGLFGTKDEQPLPSHDNNVLQKLKEINEWSKAYVGQSISARLVCDNPNCAYYGHEGCTEADHPVRKVEDGTYTYYDGETKMDLANLKRIHSFFSAYGLTDVQIAAICGNMTIESGVDFTCIEGYYGGDRYALDPSAIVDGYGFKPWAEGLNGSPIGTATCMHEISSNQYSGEDQPINYAAYSAEYPAIHKLGIGAIQFTDGPGFYNNTFLRNYADYLNDRVVTIKRIIEGSRGWREHLRQLAADKYHLLYGAEGDDKRGTGNNYVEKVEDETMLILPGAEMSTGWRWKLAYEDYMNAGDALKAAVDDYNALSQQYQNAADTLRNTNWKYHTVNETPAGGGGSPGSDSVYDITFEKYNIEDCDKKTTDDNEDNRYLDICVPEEPKEIMPETITPDVYIEYPNNPSGPKNHTDVHFPEANPVYEENNQGDLSTFSFTCQHVSATPPIPLNQRPEFQMLMSQLYALQAQLSSTPPWSPMFGALMSQLSAIQQQLMALQAQYDAEVAAYQQAAANAAEAEAEHDLIAALVAQANALVPDIQMAYEDVQVKKEEFFKKVAEFNAAALAHAISVVQFYNALQDYYTASEYDMESKIRDATYTKETIFDNESFYSEPAYEYEFETSLGGEKIKFRDVFDSLRDIPADEWEAQNPDADIEPPPDTQELRLYYELWQNYAKYATNLPQNGKYINWWTPEVQLLYMVGGAYDAEKGRGIKVRDEYREEATCQECGGSVPERDTNAEYYYNWMSTWKGDDFTGRDLTTATKNYYYDMVSGGFNDGTLKDRTEYAYAYYYMFQYGTPYQQALNYSSVGDEAAKIMDEMIAEGRWQTNMSNTLSDTAMPRNDKWKEYQESEIIRQWEIDTSTAMSTSILHTLGSKQSRSKVNLLENIWNGCKYVNVIDNSTIGNSALYLVDNPLIYESESDKFYKMKYGDAENSATEPISALYKVVYNTINRRLQDKGKTTMGGDDKMTDGFTFVKTSVLWSGMDMEFENITDVDELTEYFKEATSSVWQDEEEYQNDPDDEKAIGRGNSKIWEQRRLGPYYDESGNVYYRYAWYLVPRVLSDENLSETDLKWYDDMRNDGAEKGFGDIEEDLDKYKESHEVDEHNTNNTPSEATGEDVDGYKRKLAENERIADWIRVDWECWDPDCTECEGKGGHGDFNTLAQGDIIIKDDKVYIWLGTDAVEAMFPLEKDPVSESGDSSTSSDDYVPFDTSKLCMAGGDEAQKLKSVDTTGFEWSKPCEAYVDHETPCPEHGVLEELPTTPEPHDPEACMPYNPEGKWTVYRCIVPNYTDTYRSAGILYDPTDEDDWEIWYKYRYKGMEPTSDTRQYLEEIRKELGLDIDTDYPRDRVNR